MIMYTIMLILTINANIMKKIMTLVILLASMASYASNHDNKTINSSANKDAVVIKHSSQDKHSGLYISLGAGLTGYTGDFDMSFTDAFMAGTNGIYIGFGYDHSINDYAYIGLEARLQQVQAGIIRPGPYNTFDEGGVPLLLTSKIFPFNNNINIIANAGLILGQIRAYKPNPDKPILHPSQIVNKESSISPIFETGIAYQFRRLNVALKYQLEYIGISPEGYSSSGTLQSLVLGLTIYV